jgi:hypothetical protein
MPSSPTGPPLRGYEPNLDINLREIVFLGFAEPISTRKRR